MPEADHAVASAVIQHGTFERHYPGPGAGQADIRIDCVIGIKVDETILHGSHLIHFVHGQQIAELLLQRPDRIQGSLHGLRQTGIALGKLHNRFVGKAAGANLTTKFPELIELINNGHMPNPLQGF